MDNKEKYFNSEEFHELLSRYEASIREKRDEYFGSEELSDIAEFYYNEGKRQMAVDTLDYAIRLHPGAAMPLVFKGRMALLDEGDIDKARYYANNIADAYDLDCLYLKAEIMIAEDNADGANRMLHDAADKIDEDDLPDYVLDIAMMFIDYNLADLADEWLKLSDEDDLQDYREVKARIAFAKGDYEASGKLFEQLLEEDPYSARYWNSLASTQLMSNHINDAITSSEYSIAINPNDEEAIFNKANGLFTLGNYEEALKYYKKFHALNPNDGMALSLMGNCMLNMGRAAEALDCYRKGIDDIKRNGGTNLLETMQCMAFAHAELKQYDEALECIDKAMKLSNANKAELMVIRGQIVLEAGKLKESVECFLGALKLSQFSHEIFFRIAVSVYECGYLPIAYRMFKAYTDMHRNKGDEGSAYLASCCLRMKRHSEYMKYLRLSCDINPTEAGRVLGDQFPKGMNPKEYYDYELKKDI